MDIMYKSDSRRSHPEEDDRVNTEGEGEFDGK